MVLIVDLMLVIGGFVIVIIDLLKKVGCSSIKVLVLVVVLEGIVVLEKVYLDVELYIVLID